MCDDVEFSLGQFDIMCLKIWIMSCWKGIKIDAYREEGSMLLEGSTGRVQGVNVALSNQPLG